MREEYHKRDFLAPKESFYLCPYCSRFRYIFKGRVNGDGGGHGHMPRHYKSENKRLINRIKGLFDIDYLKTMVKVPIIK